jgi:hypothetical protein
LLQLITWLEAAGEFEQETLRLNNWRSFLSTLPGAEADRWIETAAELFDWFQCEANGALGVYTHGVARFLAVEYARRGCREDQIFCGKEPTEYHLSVVAAKIMNRGLSKEFEVTPQRVVLVPARTTCEPLQGAGIGHRYRLCRLRSSLRHQPDHLPNARHGSKSFLGPALNRIQPLA